MKKLILLSLFSACYASENDKGGVHVNNTVTITNPPVIVKQVRPGPKHPDVVAAHARARQQQDEDDFITCCCFLKIKKIK